VNSFALLDICLDTIFMWAMWHFIIQYQNWYNFI